MPETHKFTLMWVEGALNTPKVEQFETQTDQNGRTILPDRAKQLMGEYDAQIHWDDKDKEWYEPC